MYLRARRNIDDEATRRAVIAETAGLKRYDDEEAYYLSRWEHSGSTERARTDRIMALVGLAPMLGEESNSAFAACDGSYVEVTAAYWRKANAVHAWFVDHCQDGIDECQEAEVHPEQLAALVAACEVALQAYAYGDLEAASKAMPPRSGFFFGGTEIDEWWVQDLEYTVREIHRVIKAAIEIGGVTFIYQSSW